MDDPRSILIALIYLDFKEKLFELIDTLILLNCEDPSLVFFDKDKLKFGFICKTTCKDGRLIVIF